ncbi:glyoxylate/hydroxypyruvate reductase A-like isoform X2 [Macrobrachium rosenbergii]|uniref:glyoxylate/hydroxypyruvate reductase A-like isoform X2 n=1 Tax=Macrobrachium rosenbergii TaxID=79674 RepID=UPI0034D57405
MAALQRVYIYSTIPRLLTTVQDKLPGVEVIDVTPRGSQKVCEEIIEALKDAEVLLVDNNLLTQVAHSLPKLKWAQGTWAGVETLVEALRDKPKPSFAVTRLVDEAFSQLMAEYVIGWIIAHERGLLQVWEGQVKSVWSQRGNIGYYRSIQDLTVGIMGMGNMGKEVARTLKTFRAVVNAYVRTRPSEEKKYEHVDKYWHGGELSAFLRECDYIVNVMPSTPATREMLGGEVLKDAKEGAVFINIGRGDVISEKDIINSLDVGWISAAILDVFDKEPLPTESPLWKHPKVFITPHVAGVSRPEDVVRTFLFNYKRYIQGLPVMYMIDWDVGY